MQVRVKLYGLFTIGIDDPNDSIELTLPQGADVTKAIETLHRISPQIDPRACLAMVNGTRVELDRMLEDGEEINLYPLFSGG